MLCFTLCFRPPPPPERLIQFSFFETRKRSRPPVVSKDFHDIPTLAINNCAKNLETILHRSSAENHDPIPCHSDQFGRKGRRLSIFAPRLGSRSTIIYAEWLRGSRSFGNEGVCWRYFVLSFSLSWSLPPRVFTFWATLDLFRTSRGCHHGRRAAFLGFGVSGLCVRDGSQYVPIHRGPPFAAL